MEQVSVASGARTVVGDLFVSGRSSALLVAEGPFPRFTARPLDAADANHFRTLDAGGRKVPVLTRKFGGLQAVEAKGPRMVVFRVAGIIHLETPLKINHPFLTIAGQSAPGDGVCIRNHTVEINTHDVLIRYLRFRRGNLKVRDDWLARQILRRARVFSAQRCRGRLGVDRGMR